MSDFHLMLSSQDSKQYFADNTVGYFRVKLEQPVILEGNGWHVGVCEINGTAWDVASDDTIYMFCNLTTGIQLPSNKEGLLRAMNIVRATNSHMQFTHVVYTPIQTHFIDVIEITVTVNGFVEAVGDGKVKVKSTNGPVPNTWCLLHFKLIK
jgi:hypothetical protein